MFNYHLFEEEYYMNSNIIPFKRQRLKPQEPYQDINKRLDEILEQVNQLNQQIEVVNNWFNLKKSLKAER